MGDGGNDGSSNEWIFERPATDTECAEPPMPYLPMSKDLDGEWFAISSDTVTDTELLGSITLTLLDNEISGFASCNTYRGTVRMDTSSPMPHADLNEAGIYMHRDVSVSDLEWTEKSCRDELMVVEQHYLEALSNVYSFSYTAIWDQDGTPTFQLGMDAPDDSWEFRRLQPLSSTTTNEPTVSPVKSSASAKALFGAVVGAISFGLSLVT